MELVKNFSDETGKRGNPGRFTGHLAQAERTQGGVGDIKLHDMVHLKGSFTGAVRREAFLTVQVVALSPSSSPECTHRCAHTGVHSYHSRT